MSGEFLGGIQEVTGRFREVSEVFEEILVSSKKFQRGF